MHIQHTVSNTVTLRVSHGTKKKARVSDGKEHIYIETISLVRTLSFHFKCLVNYLKNILLPKKEKRSPAMLVWLYLGSAVLCGINANFSMLTMTILIC